MYLYIYMFSTSHTLFPNWIYDLMGFIFLKFPLCHKGAGFIQSIGNCDLWWQELEITLILYGTVNPPLRLHCHCQMYLRCILATSPQHRAHWLKKKMNAVERQCHLHFTSPESPLLPVSFFLGGFFSTSYIHHIPLCISASVPSKQNHTTHSDLICLSFLLFHKLQRWHSGVSVAPWDGVLDVLEGVTTKAVQSTHITPSATVIVKCFWLICTNITQNLIDE